MLEPVHGEGSILRLFLTWFRKGVNGRDPAFSLWTWAVRGHGWDARAVYRGDRTSAQPGRHGTQPAMFDSQTHAVTLTFR